MLRAMARYAGVAALVLTILLLLSTAGRAQGCAQCRDNVRATPPAVQHAYRQAIGLLGGTALTLCSIAAVVVRRSSR